MANQVSALLCLHWDESQVMRKNWEGLSWKSGRLWADITSPTARREPVGWLNRVINPPVRGWEAMPWTGTRR